jgi:hypothetical protein
MRVPSLGAPPGRLFQTFGRTTRRVEYSYHPSSGRGPTGLRPLYCPWPRCFVYLPIAFGAAFTLRCCALRGASGGATMTIEALVGFGFPVLPRPGFFYNTPRCGHPSSGVPGSIGVGLC